MLSVDWRVDLATLRELVGPRIALQGNVDPTALLAPASNVEEEAVAAMRAAGTLGHLLNLGHGILPATPLASAQAFVDAPKRVAVAS